MYVFKFEESVAALSRTRILPQAYTYRITHCTRLAFRGTGRANMAPGTDNKL
jgi:hypothetical protein